MSLYYHDDMSPKYILSLLEDFYRAVTEYLKSAVLFSGIYKVG